MAAIITDALRVYTAKALRDYIADASNSLYMYLAKDSQWGSSDIPEQPVNNLKSISAESDDIIIVKRLLAGNVTHAINRYNWEFGEVFSQYDTSNTTLNTNEVPYYCITPALNVYKCLGNNFSSPSLKEPIGVSVTPFTLDDGYTWKYMYTLVKQIADAFMTDQFIPVKETAAPTEGQWLVQATAKPGAIESYIVRNKGRGYTTASVSITGDGVGAVGIPIIKLGEIVGIAVSDPGTGYTHCECTIVGNGAGATADPQVAPLGGHGSNPVTELGGHYIMVQSKFEQESSPTVPNTFSFRKLGLLSSPKGSDNTQFVNFIGSGCYKVYTVTAGLVAGDYINFSDNDTARVVELGADFTGTYAILSEANGVSVGKTFFKVGDSGVTGLVTSVNPPDIKRNSGDILYSEYRAPITKNTNQIEFVRIVIEF